MRSRVGSRASWFWTSPRTSSPRVRHGTQPSPEAGSGQTLRDLARSLCFKLTLENGAIMLNGWCLSLRASALLEAGHPSFSRARAARDASLSDRTTQASLCLDPDLPTTFSRPNWCAFGAQDFGNPRKRRNERGANEMNGRGSSCVNSIYTSCLHFKFRRRDLLSNIVLEAFVTKSHFKFLFM